MKLIWYIISVLVIFLILIDNPKATNLSMFSSQSRIINSTRSTQQGLQILISANIAIFFILIVLLVLGS